MLDVMLLELGEEGVVECVIYMETCFILLFYFSFIHSSMKIFSGDFFMKSEMQRVNRLELSRS